MTAAVFELHNEQRAAVKSESGGEARTGMRGSAVRGQGPGARRTLCEAWTYRCARMLLTARAESSLVPSSR